METLFGIAQVIWQAQAPIIVLGIILLAAVAAVIIARRGANRWAR